MSYTFNIQITYEGGNWIVTSVEGVDEGVPFPIPVQNLPFDVKELKKMEQIKSVEIHMMRLLDRDTPTNRWCVVNQTKYWCPG